ncbi:MAG: SoxR reducing system RseC family protein [Saccharospirillum sp.]
MIYEAGQIIASDPDTVRVAVVRTSACQACQARHGCGQAVLSQIADGDRQQAKNHFTIPYSGQARAGDWAQLAIAEDRLTRAAFWVYLWPLLVAFTALLVASRLGFNEPVQLLLTLAGGALALLWTRRRFQRVADAWVPRIVSIQPGSPAHGTERQPGITAASETA